MLATGIPNSYDMKLKRFAYTAPKCSQVGVQRHAVNMLPMR